MGCDGCGWGNTDGWERQRIAEKRSGGAVTWNPGRVGTVTGATGRSATDAVDMEPAYAAQTSTLPPHSSLSKAKCLLAAVKELGDPAAIEAAERCMAMQLAACGDTLGDALGLSPTSGTLRNAEHKLNQCEKGLRQASGDTGKAARARRGNHGGRS